MKDDKILKGGPGLAGRGVYRDKMGAHAGVRHFGPGCNRLFMDTDSAQLRRLDLPNDGGCEVSRPTRNCTYSISGLLLCAATLILESINASVLKVVKGKG